jgi:hypothetical protein
MYVHIHIEAGGVLVAEQAIGDTYNLGQQQCYYCYRTKGAVTAMARHSMRQEAL